MKSLIIYASKYGATCRIAQNIAELLGNATLCDAESKESVSLADYDRVVIGSRLMAGTVRKSIKDFVARNKNELGTKRTGIFVSGLLAENEAEYFQKNFPQWLLDITSAKAHLGGIFDPENCNSIDRMIMKKVAKITEYTCTIDEEKICAFVNSLNRVQ